MKKIFLISLLLVLIKVNLFALHYEIDDARYAPSDTYENFVNPTLDGGVFYITQYGSLDVHTSTFTKNYARIGGVIYNDGGILNIQSGSTFNKNTSQLNRTYSSCIAGVIYNNNGIVSIASNVSFINNNVSDNTTNGGMGGAIYNKNNKEIFAIGSDCLFYGNSITYRGGEGGAIYNDINGIMEIGKNSTFVNNVILSTTTYKGNRCVGGAIFNNSGTINIGSNAFFYNNVVENYDVGNSRGGAISSYGKLIFDSNVQFINNLAITYNDNGEAEGGAIYNISKNITIKDGAIFSNNKATTSGGAIYNCGVINLIANTHNIKFTGNTANGISNAIHDCNGTINLWASSNADIIFNDRITSQGNSSRLNINSSTTTLNAIGKVILNENMTGFNGEVNLYGGELKLEKNARFFSGKINLSSGTLNIQNNSIDSNIVISKLSSTNNANLNIDVNLKNNASDNFTIDTAEGSINLTSINILDISDNNKGSIRLFNFNKSPAINILTMAYYNWTEYIFTNTTETGVLNWEKGETKTLKEIVNINIPSNRTVTLTNNESVTENLQTLGGSQLTIYGNDKNITGNNVTGIYVGSGKILNINNTNNYSGFNSTYGAIKNEGTLNISGTNFSNNQQQDIINNEILNLISQSSSFSKGITGTGITNIKNCSINLNNATIKQNNITIDSSGILNSNATNINSNITNNGNLIFNGGTNNNVITGTGITQISNDIINQANITQNKLEILSNKKLINSTATITINELLTINNNSKIINDGKLVINDGTNNGNIGQTINTSTITINKNFINNGTINQNILTINNQLTNNSEIIAKDIYINGTFKLGENGKFYNATNSTLYNGTQIDLQNNKIQQHNFGSLTINSGIVNLSIDVDLKDKTIDIISATNFTGNGKINIKNINIIEDTKEDNILIYFADNNLKNNVKTDIKTAYTSLYKYSVYYDDLTGNFNFFKSSYNIIDNPIAFENTVSNQIGAYITQVNVIEQALTNIDSQINVIQHSKNNRNLYASNSNVIFKEKNSIEQGLWLRPYAVSETITVDDTDIKNDAYGTVGGLDLQISNSILASFYIGYATSKQSYEEININQSGYLLGLTGSYITENYYLALTANAIFNKADAQNMFGTDNIENNSYTLAGKTGIDVKLCSKLTLQPNLLLMYSMINTADYVNSQNKKITSDTATNLHIEPRLKIMLNLENQFTPYAIVSMAFNSNSSKVMMEDIVLPEKEIGTYSDFGIGFEKNWNSWNLYLQGTGRFGARQGFGVFGGLKYKFGKANDKISKQLKEEINDKKSIDDFETIQLKKQLEKEQKELEEMEKEND